VTGTRNRQARLQAKAREKNRAELAAELTRLAARPDYKPELNYFLDLFGEGLSVSTVARRVERPVAAVMCFQAPLELFHAFGLHPFKIFSGSLAAGQMAAPHLPALTCPLLRSALGALDWGTGGHLNVGGKGASGKKGACGLVIPTTCDWVVKFPEMARMVGSAVPEPVHWLELPRLKDSPRARERWFSEVVALGKTWSSGAAAN